MTSFLKNMGWRIAGGRALSTQNLCMVARRVDVWRKWLILYETKWIHKMNLRPMTQPTRTCFSASFSSVSFSLTLWTNIWRIWSSLCCISSRCSDRLVSYVSWKLTGLLSGPTSLKPIWRQKKEVQVTVADSKNFDTWYWVFWYRIQGILIPKHLWIK